MFLHTCTCTCTHVPSHVHMYVHTCSCTRAHVHAHMHHHTFTRTCTDVPACTRAYIRGNMHMCTCICTTCTLPLMWEACFPGFELSKSQRIQARAFKCTKHTHSRIRAQVLIHYIFINHTILDIQTLVAEGNCPLVIYLTTI